MEIVRTKERSKSERRNLGFGAREAEFAKRIEERNRRRRFNLKEESGEECRKEQPLVAAAGIFVNSEILSWRA